jgi:mRNA interferase RelE/StbE
VTRRRRGPHRLAITPAAALVLTERLPATVAAAVHTYLTTVLVADPYCEGRPLALAALSGTWSAQRGAYRVLYRIDDDAVTVLAVSRRPG